MNQKQLVLEYIERFGSITPMQAFADLGITKLATVVSEMRRKEGKFFVIERVDTVNRFGRPVWYCKYSLPKEGNV